MTLNDLIEEGVALLNKILPIMFHDEVSGVDATNIKSLHVRGRILLKDIDNITYEEYKSLFSLVRSHETRWEQWNAYLRTELEKCIGILKAVQIVGIENIKDKSIKTVFVSHGKFSPAFTKLESYLRALNLFPVYDTNEPSEGKTINKHVSDLFGKADFYIILATKETSNDKGICLPNHNVTIEFDRLFQLGKGNMVVLLEDGCKLPSMHQDVIYANFSLDTMDNAFIKLASEFVRHDIL
jgi:predicted nucleotide-binding protein